MHKDDKKKRAEEIIDGYYHKKLRSETEKTVQGWISSEHNPHIGVFIAKLFSEEVKAAAAPDKNTRRSLEEVQKILGFPQKRTIQLGRRLMKVAAVLVPALIVGGSLFFMLNDNPADTVPEAVAQIQVEVPTVVNKEITLPDGSEIKLAEGTEFSYSEDFENDRTVYLNGEAYFKVEKRGGRTFTVRTSSISVTVLGTEFSMKARDKSQTAEVVLTTGKVEVEAEGVDNTTMSPGERIVYDKEHRTITVDEIGERELMRLRGMSLDFDNSLDEIFQTISRYYGKPLIVHDSMDLSRKIVVPFKGNETVEQVMDGLQFMTGGAFDYAITKDTIRITNPN